MLNNQPPEPLKISDGSEIDLYEMFYTLQGEGPFAGYPAIFVRLAGCNLQCPLCDTIYTRPNRTPRERGSVVRSITMLHDMNPATKIVVITGGEPLRQNITPLIYDIIEKTGLPVQIETNGVFKLSDDLDRMLDAGKLYLIVSPKTNRVNPYTAIRATAFKYVLKHTDVDPSDGLPTQALGHKANPRVARPPDGWNGLIYVNPCDDKDDEINRLNMIAARDSAMRFGHILGVQMHKLVDIP